MSIEESFVQSLTNHFKENKKGLIPKNVYQRTIDTLKDASSNPHAKGRRGYYLLEKYELLQVGSTEKLIKKRFNEQEPPLYYVSIEETFDVVKSAHILTGHGGRDRMLKVLQKKYANIPTKAVELFKSLCEECQKKGKRPMTKRVRPMFTKELSSRGQVDLIDMQGMPSSDESNKKWLLVYQDHRTKFCILRALNSKGASEVASHLLDIFLLFGAPVILQSGQGTQFTSQVITELKELWPKPILVIGKPPQSQAECANIKELLDVWMADNDSKDWLRGIKFVQFQKNNGLHSGIKRSPYSAMFGTEARLGLTSSSSLPMEVIAQIKTEEDIRALSHLRPDFSLPQSESNQMQASTSDESSTHDFSEDFPLEYVSAQYNGDNNGQRDKTECDSPTLKSEEPLSPSPSDEVDERLKRPRRGSNDDQAS